MTIETFWNHFLKTTNRNINTRYDRCFHFCSTKKLANQMLSLVLDEKKRATSSSYPAYQITKSPLPQVGNLSIVTGMEILVV